MEYQQTKYTVQEIVEFINIEWSEEEFIQKIDHCKDMKQLLLYLEINQYLIDYKKRPATDLPTSFFLKLLDTFKSDNDTSYCLFIAFKTLKNPAKLVSFITQLEIVFEILQKGNFHTEETAISHFKLLATTLDICNEIKEYESVQILMNMFEKHILHFILQKGVKINQFIKVYVISKYLLCTKSNKILAHIWKHILDLNDVNLLCVYSNFYIVFEKNQDSDIYYDITEEEQFWCLVQNNINNKSNIVQKQCIFLLKMAIDKLYNNSNNLKTIPELVTNDPRLNVTLYNRWKTFFILMELSKEKQLHLLKPVFGLLDDLNELHPSWKTVVYLRLLSHPQDVVVALSVLNILSSDVHETGAEFNRILLCLLSALNNTFLYSSKYKADVLNALVKFLKKIAPDQIINLLEASHKLSWAPIPLYHFYTCLKGSQVLQVYHMPLSNVVLTQLDKLPHSNFRLAILYTLIDAMHYSSESPSIFTDNAIHYSMLLKTHKLRKSAEVMLPEHKFTVGADVCIELENVLDQFSKDRCNSEHVQSFMCYFMHVQKSYRSDLPDLHIETFEFAAFLRRSLLQRLNDHSFPSSNVYAMLPALIVIVHRENGSFDNIIEFVQNETKAKKYGDAAKTKALCKAVKQLLALGVDSLENLFAMAKNSILNKDLHISATELNLNLKLVNIAISCSCLKTDETLLQAVSFWTEHLASSTNKDILNCCKSVLNLLQHFVVFFKSEQILPIVNLTLETQSTVKVIVPVLQCLKALIDESDHTAEILQTVNVCFKAMLEIKNTPKFLKALNVFVAIIFRSNVAQNEKRFEQTLYFTNKLFELSETMPSVSAIVCKRLHAMLNKSSLESVEKYLNIVARLLLSGNVLRRDQRIEFATYVSEKWAFEYSDMYKDVNVTRGTAVRIVIDLIDRTDAFDDKVAVISKLINILMDEYKVGYKKRYFENSQLHLTKLRITQVLLLLKSFIVKDQAAVCTNFFMKSLSEESHQHSVKNIIQLLLTKLLLQQTHECRIETLREQMETLETMQNTAVTGVIPIVYYLCLHTYINGNRDSVYEYLNLLGPLTMGPQFNVRLHAQYAYSKLFEHCRIANSDSLHANIVRVLKRTKINEANVHLPFLYDALHASDGDVGNVFTIYCDLPRIYGVDNYEWHHLEHYFASCCSRDTSNNGRPFRRHKTLKRCEQQVDAAKTERDLLEDLAGDDCGGDCGGGSAAILQRKITPWTDEMQQSNKTLGDLIVVASLVDRTPNLGGLSRTCEIFGVKQYVLNSLQHLKDKEFQSLSMSSEKWIDAFEVKVNQLTDFLVRCKENGYSVVGVEQTSDSVLLPQFKFDKKTVLLLGHEKEGIPPNLLHLMDTCVEIPQFGVVRSLNVHVAGALMIWEYTKEHLFS